MLKMLHKSSYRANLLLCQVYVPNSAIDSQPPLSEPRRVIGFWTAVTLAASKTGGETVWAGTALDAVIIREDVIDSGDVTSAQILVN